MEAALDNSNCAAVRPENPELHFIFRYYALHLFNKDFKKIKIFFFFF